MRSRWPPSATSTTSSSTPTGELWADRHAEALHRNPIYTGDQSDKLAEFLDRTLSAGDGDPVMNRVLESRYRPSRKLLEHTAAMIAANSDFVLLDEQRVAFESVLAEARDGFHDAKKSVVLVQGGPGTGKSIIALHLVGELAKRGYNAMHATGSKAFTENMRRVVGSRAGQSQFKYFNQFGNADANDVDVLILDEAHRLRETSASRFTPKAKRTDLPQVDELIKAAKTTVFFIDDHQVVRPNETGSTQLILEAADRNGADVTAFELETQFRLSGSKAFLTWVDGMLGLTPESATPTWDPDKETFDFRIVDSVEQLDALIRTKADEGHSARLTAGFCWPWSNPEADGTLVNDVKVGAWQMPWNAKPDAGRLAPGIPPSNFWASDPNGLDQVGCVYTAQGFEFDYVGVIWGRDLRWDPATTTWIGDPSHSHDSIVKRSGDRFTDLVKRTYRVLLTRGLKGCYVYFEDGATRRHSVSESTELDGDPMPRRRAAQATGSVAETGEEVVLEIDYAIIRHFSQHLYGSPNKAVEELVANGFDAFATKVYVYLPGANTASSVIVWDNGTSMDIDGLKALWWIARTESLLAMRSATEFRIYARPMDAICWWASTTN